jgi:hypothetical protein
MSDTRRPVSRLAVTRRPMAPFARAHKADQPSFSPRATIDLTSRSPAQPQLLNLASIEPIHHEGVDPGLCFLFEVSEIGSSKL